MAMHHLASTITCHTWNADRSMLALCPNNEELWIYTGCTDPDSTNWLRKWVLKQHSECLQHDMVISSVSWHPVTNKIVTVSHDRNGFVWTYSKATDAWEPTVCMLQLDKAALDVKWSPDGTRFAVASSNKSVVVCWYDDTNKWWVGKVCKPKGRTTAHSSCVALDWHPNGLIIAVASTDYRVRVLLADLEKADTAEKDDDDKRESKEVRFGSLLNSYEMTKAWINDVAFSPSGRQLAFISHDGLLHVVDEWDNPSCPVVTVKTTGLPASKLQWISETALVTAGHNMNPDVFSKSSGKWALVGACDVKSAGGHGPRASKAYDSAKALFTAKVSKGAGEIDDASSVWTKHHGAITCLQPVSRSGSTTKFSTSGNDGRVVVWDLSALAHIPAATYA